LCTSPEKRKRDLLNQKIRCPELHISGKILKEKIEIKENRG
jgi:hypothetical protein